MNRRIFFLEGIALVQSKEEGFISHVGSHYGQESHIIIDEGCLAHCSGCLSTSRKTGMKHVKENGADI